MKTLERAHENVVRRENKKKQERVEASRKKKDMDPYRLGDLGVHEDSAKARNTRECSTPLGWSLRSNQLPGNTYRIKREDNFRHRFIRHFDQLKPVGRRQPHLTSQVDKEQGAATDEAVRQPTWTGNEEMWESESESESENVEEPVEESEAITDWATEA